MKLLSLCLPVFAVAYFLLRSFKPQWEKGKLARSMRFLLGMISWVIVLSFAGILVGFAQPVIQLFTSPNMGVGFLIGGLALAVSAIWKYSAANPELFDFPHMKQLIKESLTFDDPSRRRNSVFHDLEQHEIRRVYREVAGKDLPADRGEIDRQLGKTLKRVTGREFREDGRAKVEQNEIAKLLAQPIESPTLREELKQLAFGQAVDITDSWKINSTKRSSHDWYMLVGGVHLDPQSKILNLDLHSERFPKEQLLDNTYLYRFKQDLYDFLQAVYQEEWMKPYLKHAEQITCRCCTRSFDAFDGERLFPVLQVEITTAELKLYSDKFFNVGNMRSELLFGQS